MNCIDLVVGIANRLNEKIRQQHQVYALQTEDFGWINYRYRSPKFRLAHIEIFNQDPLIDNLMQHSKFENIMQYSSFDQMHNYSSGGFMN